MNGLSKDSRSQSTNHVKALIHRSATLPLSPLPLSAVVSISSLFLFILYSNYKRGFVTAVKQRTGRFTDDVSRK